MIRLGVSVVDQKKSAIQLQVHLPFTTSDCPDKRSTKLKVRRLPKRGPQFESVILVRVKVLDILDELQHKETYVLAYLWFCRTVLCLHLFWLVHDNEGTSYLVQQCGSLVCFLPTV